jgi:hypothetical protein
MSGIGIGNNRIAAFLISVPLLLAIVTAVLTGQARGYEISIYAAYPMYFWLLVIISLGLGVCVLVNQSFARRKSYLWIIVGFLIVASTNLLVLTLPAIRGYTSWATTDTLTHLGYIKDIMNTGHFAPAGVRGENFYPAIHILSSAICYATGIKPEFLVMVFTAFFFLFYVLSIFFLSKQLTQNLGAVILITTFGSLVMFEIYQVSFLPSTFGFFLIPFILFLYFKSRASSHGTKFLIPLSLLLFALPFYHPGEVPLFLIIIFVCIGIGYSLSRRINRHRISPQVSGIRKSNFPFAIYPIGILAVSVFTWFSTFGKFEFQVPVIANWLLQGSGESSIASTLNLLNRANLSALQFADLFTKLYGQMLVYFVVSLIFSVVVLRKILFSRDQISPNKIIFVILFVLFGIGIFVFAFNEFFLSYDRELRWVIFASTVLNGLSLYELYSTTKKQNMIKAIKLITIILLISSMIIGLFNTYNSPIIKTYNDQVTLSEMSGMNLFFNHQDGITYTVDMYTASYRFAYGILGVETSPVTIRVDPILPPNHFGYSTYATLGESYHTDQYLIENTLTRIIYPQTAAGYESQWRFTSADFARLQNDPSVNFIYSNGDLRIYRIHGEAK